MRPAGDRSLIRSVDRALAEAARKCGAWLACHAGCTECCKGPFSITQLDALRLRLGLAKLAKRAPRRAARVRARAREAAGRPAGDDDFCPALDPATGRCDLYAARPITCRTFGPPVRCGAEAVGICELCFRGASDAEIAACEVAIDAAGLESTLLEELERITGLKGDTTVVAALV
jgi:Fe-S-cluster containining protein